MMSMTYRRKQMIWNVVWAVVTVVVFVLVLFPPLMLFLTSIKTNVDALKYPPVWIFRPVVSV